MLTEILNTNPDSLLPFLEMAQRYSVRKVTTPETWVQRLNIVHNNYNQRGFLDGLPVCLTSSIDYSELYSYVGQPDDFINYCAAHSTNLSKIELQSIFHEQEGIILMLNNSPIYLDYIAISGAVINESVAVSSNETVIGSTRIIGNEASPFLTYLRTKLRSNLQSQIGGELSQTAATVNNLSFLNGDLLAGLCLPLEHCLSFMEGQRKSYATMLLDNKFEHFFGNLMHDLVSTGAIDCLGEDIQYTGSSCSPKILNIPATRAYLKEIQPTLLRDFNSENNLRKKIQSSAKLFFSAVIGH